MSLDHHYSCQDGLNIEHLSNQRHELLLLYNCKAVYVAGGIACSWINTVTAVSGHDNDINYVWKIAERSTM